MQDEKSQVTEQPDQQRRRFTKAGLVTPVVLATLASKPVLGASYNCTVSGKLSGNTSSPHETGNCVVSGVINSDSWKDKPIAEWPGVAKDSNGRSKKFNVFFSNVYFKPNNNEARLVDVLTGNLASPPHFDLGKEAVAALLNSIVVGAPANFPLPQAEITRLFNGVINGGTVLATTNSQGKLWGVAEVLTYFKCINGSAACPARIPEI